MNKHGKGCPHIVTASPAVSKMMEMARRVAHSSATILIQGESGTGKELVARELHLRSRRAQMPFHAVNCAAIPSNLLESEFFGYKKGAFTNAYKDKKGLFQEAHQGTVFLDEIGMWVLPSRQSCSG